MFENCLHLTDWIFEKMVETRQTTFLNFVCLISCKIALKSVPKGTTDNKSTVVQVMAWLCTSTTWIDHTWINYCQTFDIRCTKSQNLNVSRLVLRLSLPNPLAMLQVTPVYRGWLYVFVPVRTPPPAADFCSRDNFWTTFRIAFIFGTIVGPDL